MRRDIPDRQEMVKEKVMYGKTAGAGGAIGGMLPVTGVNILTSALIAFVLIGAGFAVVRCLPKRRTA
jgi:hypothetical protein